MRVLITGGTGRIGANVVKRLAERGDKLRCVVRPGTPRQAKLTAFDVEILEVDLTDREGLAQTVKGMDAIVHLGAKLGGTTNTEQVDVNLVPTVTLLEAARTLNPGLRRFVFGSSDTLYPHTGYMPGLIAREDIFTRPRSMYAVAKLAGEAAVQCYHQQYGLPTVSLSIPYTFCGREFLGERTLEISPYIEHHIQRLEGQPTSPEVERAIRELRTRHDEGKRLVVPVCPEGPVFKHHLGDVRDVARACELALEADAAVGESLIIMSWPFHFDKAVRRLSHVSGLDYAEVIFPAGTFYEYDIRHAKDLLGYVPRFDGPRMLEDAWKQKHGQDIGIVDVDVSGPSAP